MGSKIDLGGANVLPWLRGFRIGAILDASRTFEKSGGLRGCTKVVTGAQEAPRGVNGGHMGRQ